MKRFLPILLIVGLFAGCELDNKIQLAREAKYITDHALVQTMRAYANAADEMVAKKHAMQLKKIEDDLALFFRVNGLQQDAEGNITGGTIAYSLLLPSLNTHQADLDKLELSKKSWADIQTQFLAALDAYEKTNQSEYDTEEKAMEAKRTAQAALDAALQAIGTFSGGLMTGLLAG
jgi:hypothetical protein